MGTSRLRGISFVLVSTSSSERHACKKKPSAQIRVSHHSSHSGKMFQAMNSFSIAVRFMEPLANHLLFLFSSIIAVLQMVVRDQDVEACFGTTFRCGDRA